MDTLARLELKPLGVWTTPWQADSLLGAIACTWARTHGQDALRRNLLDPWRAGDPPFVISDAFPGDLLPVPVGVPLWWKWPPDARKAVKKRRWIDTTDFRRIQRGEKPMLDQVPVPVRENVRLRNSILRGPKETGASGELFEVPYSDLISDADDRHLTIYCRASEHGMDLLVQALEMLGRTGFGADASVGHGAFEPAGDPERCPEFSDVTDADGFISLSTYQPAPADPTDGFWRTFVKYGKLAPEFHDRAVFKRPQVMIEAGACFRTGDPPRPFYGGLIEPERLLAAPARETLAETGVHPVQAAFALAAPIRWPFEHVVNAQCHEPKVSHV